MGSWGLQGSCSYPLSMLWYLRMNCYWLAQCRLSTMIKLPLLNFVMVWRKYPCVLNSSFEQDLCLFLGNTLNFTLAIRNVFKCFYNIYELWGPGCRTSLLGRSIELRRVAFVLWKLEEHPTFPEINSPLVIRKVISITLSNYTIFTCYKELPFCLCSKQNK